MPGIDERNTVDKMQELRREYESAGLDVADVDADPFREFDRWLGEAITSGAEEANAFVVATVDRGGCPSARTVLLKGFDHRGFVFYTNYESRKAVDLETNPAVAMCFVWLALHRQIRIQGTAVRISAEESDAYYASRPRAAQIGAHASPQSREIPGRDWLEERVEEVAALHGVDEVKRPQGWGGYRVVPREFEFWQGRPSRLHDRIRYRLAAPDNWNLARLAP